jgi:hypothetical protein
MVGKNAILLVDRANDLRKQGLERREALEQAGEHRFRPILMTSVVLILSMLPVALVHGDGGEVRAPLAAVLVGGMTTSTVLSLLYVPVAYTFFDNLRTFLQNLTSFRLPPPRIPRRFRPGGSGRSSSDRPSRPTPSPAPVAASQMPRPVAGGAPLEDDPAETEHRLSWVPRRRRRRRARPASVPNATGPATSQ